MTEADMNWPTRIRGEFARRAAPIDESVVEEMAQHAEAAFVAARADGMSAPEAETAIDGLIRSWCSATSGPRRIERAPLLESAPAGRSPFAGLGLDFRLAARGIRHQPGFAIVSIALIALAIAAATSIFSVVNSVVLRPMPSVDMNGLVRVFDTGHGGEPATALTNSLYHAWRESPTTIDGIAAWDHAALADESPSGLELVRGAKVTASLFPLIGVAPGIGRHFRADQEVTDDAIILSHGFWKERFGGAPDVLGRRLTLGGRPRTVIGVMPREFAFPDREARVWVAMRPPNLIQRVSSERGQMSVTMQLTRHNGLARLRPGATPAQAAAEAVARDLASMPRFGPQREAPIDHGRRVVLVPMLDWMVKDVKPALWILSAAVGLLFAAAVGNVANMQLARAASRRQDAAIKTAIGAGGARLVRQLLVESGVIALAGAALGVAVTAALLRMLPALMPQDFPRLDDIAIDGRVLAVAVGLTAVIALAMSLLPARLARRVTLTSALADDGTAPVGLQAPGTRARTLIITGQVAVAALLLVGAGLLCQSLRNLIDVDRGYQPANLLTARLAHVSRGLPATARPQFYADVLARLQAMPGVTHAAVGNDLPLTPKGDRRIQGRNPAAADQPMEGDVHIVSADYVAAMGMRMVRGRGFQATDVAASGLVILVNETFAKRYLRGESLGARVSLDLDSDRPCEPTKEERSACTQPWQIVGVVGDVRGSGAGAEVLPAVFAPRSQMLSPIPSTQYVVARTAGDPAALAAELRGIVRAASSRAVVEDVMTMETRLMLSLARPRLYALLLGGFATFALLIAVIGLFGGLSYGVAQRTREFGIRTALGATPRDLVALVLKQGTFITVAGLALGFGGATASVRYLAQFLFGVTPFDIATFVVAGVTLAGVGALACAVPARRAARLDAVEALKR
jgi:putative ABC transport system permease protein